MERFQSLKGKAFFFLMLVWFLWFMNVAMRTIFSPILPILEDEFHVVHAQAASIFTFMAFGYGTSVSFSGIASSKFGCKKGVLFSLFIAMVVYFIVPTVKHFYLFYPLGFLLGIAAGMYLPSVIPMITEYYQERLWGKAISIHESAASLGIFSAPFIALFMLSFFPWRAIFILFGIVFIICMIIFQVTTKEVKVAAGKKSYLRSLLKSNDLWLMGIIWIFAAGGNLGLYFILPLYLVKELGMDVGAANTIFGISRLGGVVVGISAGFLVDRFSLKKTMFLLAFLSGLFTMLLATQHMSVMKLFLFLQSSVNIGYFPVALISIQRMFQREERGAATGFIITLGVVCGVGITPYLLGLSGDHLSFRFGIFILGALAVLSSGLVWFLKKLH
jgi:MFS transporter, NNP family, nitrate/nitrite transporter